MATVTDEPIEAHLGVLVNNGVCVEHFQQTIHRAGGSLKLIPKLFKRMIREHAWEKFATVDGNTFAWKPADFRRFLEAPRPAGCQTSVTVVARALEGSPEWAQFDEMIRGKPGGANNPTGHNQHTEVNTDNISIDHSDPPATIPMPPAPKAPHGNTASYALSRLKKQAPALAEEVIKGNLTAHAAAVKAGFHEAKVTIPRNHPARAAKILARHLGPAGVKALIAELIALTTNHP